MPPSRRGAALAAPRRYFRRCRSRALAGGGCALVHTGPEHAARRDARQLGVGCALLVERLVEELTDVLQPELGRKRARGAVAGDLVVLHPLGPCDQRGVTRRRIASGLDHLLTLAQQ